ncbi:MAG: FecR domain-containing protein [Deltaproteobacteria bacterium]|nr:FecR domain-containing protein [Deltaproteobacteria bacterium]
MRALIVILAFFFMGFSHPAIAAEKGIGVIKNIKGPVFIEREKASIPAKMSDNLFENDIIVTGKSGSMGAVLIDNSVISSGPNTRLILSQFVFNPAEKKLSSTVQITRGTFTYLSGLIAKHDGQAVKFITPSAVCGIRGTHLAIYVEDE